MRALILLALIVGVSSAASGAPGRPPCPESAATPERGGDIAVEWSSVPGADAYRVTRRAGGGAFEMLARIDAPSTRFVDTEPASGMQEYRVTAISGTGESLGCAAIAVTPVPFFGGGALLGFAAVASAVAVALVLFARRG